jgi:hypothetical protein
MIGAEVEGLQFETTPGKFSARPYRKKKLKAKGLDCVSSAQSLQFGP